jgi:hypothetical protein
VWHTASGKIQDRKLSLLNHVLDQLVGCTQFLGSDKELVFAQGLQPTNLSLALPGMTDSLHNAASSSLSPGTEQAGNMMNCFTKITASTDKGTLKTVLSI